MQDFEITPDTRIPRLSPDLKLVKGSPNDDGTPTWRLYHPVSHQYFHLGWEEFEYLSRFSLCATYQELADRIQKESTFEPDKEIFKELLLFLNQHGLIQVMKGLPLTPPEKKRKSVLTELAHKYLFFSVPIVCPQKFLEATYPYVSFFFSREAGFVTMLVLLYGLVITTGRLDEFLSTFFNLVSVEGAVTVAITFTVIKLLHELGHAYTAVKYGLKVPHMGIAFMVMYPVFYTETTSAWHLANRREKVEIGLAGMRMELMLAAIFLLVWNYAAPGLLQSIAFSVVAISLIGSFLINLNPLMRFDGYFILGDALGIDNLHSKGFAFARWKLRKMLFGWPDELPEEVSAKKKNFFIIFGWATLIYRFFLFMGIAVLVYMIFPKPLGLILMILELAWFIALPVWSELRVWLARSNELLSYTHGKITFVLGALLFLSLFLPIQGHVSIPALYHAAEHRDIYAPYPAKIVQLNILEDNFVEKGAMLARLESAELEKDYKLTLISLEELQKLQRRQQTNIELLRETQSNLENQIKDLKIKLKSFQTKRDQLTIKAPFDGYIKDVNTDIHEGRFVAVDDLLFRIVDPRQNLVTAYVTEHELERIAKNDKGEFRAAYSLTENLPVKVMQIEDTNVTNLDKEELSSVYGGAIYSEIYQSGNEPARIVPRQSLYKIILKPEREGHFLASPGVAKISGDHATPISVFLVWLYSIFLPESEII